MSVIVGNEIQLAQILAWRAALRLECKGLKRSGKSVYSIVKNHFKWTGDRGEILVLLTNYIEENILPFAILDGQDGTGTAKCKRCCTTFEYDVHTEKNMVLDKQGGKLQLKCPECNKTLAKEEDPCTGCPENFVCAGCDKLLPGMKSSREAV